MLILKILIAVGFLLAGSAKLLSAKPIVEQFEEFGLAPWMMYAVGALEIAGAIGLFISPLTFWATLGLTILMVGAIGNHIKAKHPIQQSLPAAVLLILCLVLLFV